VNTKLRCGISALVIILSLFLSAPVSHGQITGTLTSDVQGFFGSASDAYQQSEIPGPSSWTPVGFPLPHGPTALPNIPPLYAGYPAPVTPIVSNIGFLAPAGHAPSSPFTDGITSADYHIFGGDFGSLTHTGNAYVRLGNNTANLMYLNQPTGAVGYAYEEEQFAIDYSIGPNGLLPSPTPGPRPFLIFGNFNPGGSAEFGAQVNYWFQPIIPGTTLPNGPATLLGTLNYDDYLSSVTGPFASFVNNTNTGLAGVPAGSIGVLELTGDIYVEGDPVDFNVESVDVPEPTSLSLLAAAGLLLSRRRRV